MEDNQGLSVGELLCCGIQAPTHSFVDKVGVGVALNVTEASDGQGIGAIHRSRAVERGTMDWSGARLGPAGTNTLAHLAN